MTIPIVIVCYNNYKYVMNMLRQIRNLNKEYYKNIHILNNASTCPETLGFLQNIDVNVIHNQQNITPRITKQDNVAIYNMLPNKFVLTDPDLEFHPNLPSNFIEILSELSDKHKAEVVGFALKISDFDKMYQSIYYGGKTILDWESKYWINKIEDSDYELYDALIDTTFGLVNKNNTTGFHIRVAGDFTAVHLPWYITNKLYNVYENYMQNKKTTKISTTSNTIVSYIESHFLPIQKKNEVFLLRNDPEDLNFPFWRDIFPQWENGTFDVFDTFLKKDKIFIDIGGWIGTTAMYGSRKSKHVYSVEADNMAAEDMQKNLENNCEQNYTVINKAIFYLDNQTIQFGKNKFLQNARLNDSTSQIYSEGEYSDSVYQKQTITIGSLLTEYNINPLDISLIKVDIEGGEEYILVDLFDIYAKYSAPMYISFHYSWWNNKDLDRFPFLDPMIKERIRNDPFVSIVFR